MDTDQVLVRFEAEHMAPNSMSALRRAEQLKLLRRLASQLDHPLHELTGADVQSFMGAEITRGLAPNTVRKEHGMIRAFNTWATGASLISPERSAQLKSVRNPRGSTGRSTPKPYKPAEIKRLREQLAERYPALPSHGQGKYALHRWTSGKRTTLRRHLWLHATRVQLECQIALALELGLRKVEILRLTLPAVHFENDQVVVLTAKQGPGSQVTRVVPYTAHARQCAQEWLELRELLMPQHDEPWLFLKCKGSRAEQLDTLPMWKMSRALNQFGPWRWHRLRHTAATEWLRAGVPMEKVQIMMGHANPEQTRAYTHISPEDVDRAVGLAEADFSRRMGIAA
jgi:integrase